MYDALRQIPAVFVKFILIGASVSCLIGMVFAAPLTSLFLHADPSVQYVAETGVRILTLNLYFNALVTCFQSLMRSTGHRIVAVALPCFYLLAILCPLSALFINNFGSLGFFVARVVSYGMGIMIVVGACSVLKKASPLRSETYLFLPKDEPGIFQEMNLMVKRPNQIKDIIAKVSSFYKENKASKVETECIKRAFNDLIQGICLKDELAYSKKMKKKKKKKEKALLDNEPLMQCWVHVSRINNTLSVLTINGHGNASNFFVSQFIEKTRTPLEMLEGKRSSMPLIIDGKLHSIDSIFFDFLMTAAIEIKVEKE